MKPVTTVEFMKRADEKAQKTIGLTTLISRAGYKLAQCAIKILKNPYGKKVVVIYGKGNNGKDGLKAAEILKERGAKVEAISFQDISKAQKVAQSADLVIDAIFGTGFKGEFTAPVFESTVLSCDIPSGIDGDTGKVRGTAIKADYTVTFAAIKPGLILSDGIRHAGEITLADIGLDVAGTNYFLIETSDFISGYKVRDTLAHKWSYAVGIIGGSPGMMGAAMLAAKGAYHAGAGMVRLACLNLDKEHLPVSEAVAGSVNSASEALQFVDKCRAIVIGPGLSRTDRALSFVREILAQLKNKPIVIDADAIYAVSDLSILRDREVPVVVTPHEKEFISMFGELNENRLVSVVDSAKKINGYVLLKGPTTVVADNYGNARFITSGNIGLATAGTGDVLSGVIGAFLAKGMLNINGIALAAFIHGFSSGEMKADTSTAFELPGYISQSINHLVRYKK